jgi:hypothetical protein
MSSMKDVVRGQTPNRYNGALHAHFATSPSDEFEQARVVVPRMSVNLSIGPCPWGPLRSRLPKRGDRCLVLFDDNNEPWIVMWWPNA